MSDMTYTCESEKPANCKIWTRPRELINNSDYKSELH